MATQITDMMHPYFAHCWDCHKYFSECKCEEKVKKITIVVADEESLSTAVYCPDERTLDVVYRNRSIDTFAPVTPEMFSQFAKAMEMGQSFIRTLKQSKDIRVALGTVKQD